jgi:HAMP domain-containing protein
MSENRFVVEVVGKLSEPREVTVTRVQEALGLDEAKAAALVARMPGVLTRPSSEDRAMKVALRLQGAGIAALHRPWSSSENPFSTAERPPVADAAAPADAAAEAAGERPAAAASGAPAAQARAASGYDPASVPSVDATQHDGQPDPKLTPMTAAAFGAADIVLPTTPAAAPAPSRHPTFVEAGATSRPFDAPTPVPGAPTPVPERHAAGDARRAPTPVPERGAPAGETRGHTPPPDRGAEPKYRQTRSSADAPLTLSPPPDEVLKRTGVPESELASSAGRRGRFGRLLAARAALPVVLAWALGAGATWFLLEPEGRLEVFGTLAAATGLAALVGMLVAAIGARGVARDVVQLRDEARRVAMGELTAPVTTRRDDELGEIAGSLERTRLSLQEGLERLRKRARS